MKKRNTISTFFALAVVAISALALLPLAWAVLSSLKPLEQVYTWPPTFTLTSPQWSNYYEAFTRLPIGRFLTNSLFITTLSVIGAVITSSMTGFALGCLNFRNSSATCDDFRPENRKIGKFAHSGVLWYVIAHEARDGEGISNDH